MKKILISLFVSCCIFGTSFASEICLNQSITEINITIETTDNANIRNVPCIKGSEKKGLTGIGEKYKSTKLSGGYYEINKNGNKYWIWEGAVKIIENEYVFSDSDLKIINLILEKLENKSDIYKNNFITKLDILLEEYSDNKRIYSIFKEIKNKLTIEITEENKEKLEEKEEFKFNKNENFEYLEKYNVDYSQIKDYWLQLYNSARKDLDLYEYKYHSKLDNSAFIWSKTQKENTEASHKRTKESSFYDYKEITNWLGDNGVSCKNVDKYTHTENVGRGEFSCTDGECSDELKAGINRTFDFFMSEKGTDYEAHYQSIINNYFKFIGLGITINELKENYYEFYLTVHYCTELE